MLPLGCIGSKGSHFANGRTLGVLEFSRGLASLFLDGSEASLVRLLDVDSAFLFHTGFCWWLLDMNLRQMSRGFIRPATLHTWHGLAWQEFISFQHSGHNPFNLAISPMKILGKFGILEIQMHHCAGYVCTRFVSLINVTEDNGVT